MPRPGSPADHAAWLIMLVLFEGKMRALFSMLFGASLLLFMERNEAPGRHGALLQARRLLWLMLLGYLHFMLLWDGDILFLYGAIGFLALMARYWSARHLVLGAALIVTCWQGWGLSIRGGSLGDQAAILSGTASPAAMERQDKDLAWFRTADAADNAEAKLPWTGQVRHRLTERAADPLGLVGFNWGETLPWMMLGMALFKGGFFSGTWQRRSLVRLAAWGLALGGGATLAFAWWAAKTHYPAVLMHFALEFGTVLPHTAMALGYAALLVLGSRALLQSAPGQMLEAAGRMAFTNYIATSLVMTALCQDWGLGLYGQFGAAQRWTLVFLVWALILAWSQPWLERYRQGPLEWAWRSLTEWRILDLKR
ncbi:MAG: DUF418 domain-containing protein [Novosphingobium sp.]